MNDVTVIIIGAGVIGLSTAYQLAKRNFGKIILLDKDAFGDGASNRAAGIVTGLLWSETGVEARKISLALFHEFSEELKGYQFNNVGCLNLFDDASWSERKTLLPLYDRLNFRYEVLSSQEINAHWHNLIPDKEITGLFDPLGGYSEPHEYIPALKQRCLDLGVEIREDCQVTGFTQNGNNITGVTTLKDGEMGSDIVISSVHIWTLKLLKSLGYQPPMKAFVHQRYVTREMSSPVAIPAINANPQGGYIRPARIGKQDNRLLAGFETENREEVKPGSLDFNMNELKTPESVRDQMTQNLIPLVPQLTKTTWEHEKVGLISFSIDGEPIMGAVNELKGLYVAAAFHSGGFAYNPAAGQLMAELVTTGKTSIDIGAFSPQRFDKQEVNTHLRQTVTQASAVKRRH